MRKNSNAFDLLRLILASLVFISHGYLLHGETAEPLSRFSKSQFDFGQLGVLGFFALSGYLITASFERSPSMTIFAANRILRIFPGFWTCLLVTGFVIGPAIFFMAYHDLTNYSFTGSESALSFFYKNMLLQIRQWSVKDVLKNSAYNTSLNGSLWTLWHEMISYVLTIILGYFGLFKKNRQLLLILFAFVYVVYVVRFSTNITFGPTFLILSPGLRLYTAYLCGSILFVFREDFFIDRYGYIFLIIAAIALLKFGGFIIIAPVIVAILSIKCFESFNFSLKYDISYGLYIYAFPVEQLVYNFFGREGPFLIYLFVSALITILFGLLSCVAIERPFLKLKKHYVGKLKGT